MIKIALAWCQVRCCEMFEMQYQIKTAKFDQTEWIVWHYNDSSWKHHAFSAKLPKQCKIGYLFSVGNNVLMYIWINWLPSITKYLVMCLLVRFVPYEVNEDDDYTSYENMAIFLISMYQYITLAVVFSKGRPYRKTIFSNCKYELGSFNIRFLCFSPHLHY